MPVRFVVWNCDKALHSKTDFLLSLKPDIAIIPESAQPGIVKKKNPSFAYTDCDWTGNHKHIGLGVYSFNGYSFRRHEGWQKSVSHFLPVEVRGPANFNLMAVHALSDHTPPKAVTNPVTTLQALTHYEAFLTSQPSVIAGDFNANVNWDKKTPRSPFAGVHAKLEKLGYASAYHDSTGEKLGRETQPTLRWKKSGGEYHIDYLYAPRGTILGGSGVSFGKFGDERLSDHMPLIVDLEL